MMVEGKGGTLILHDCPQNDRFAQTTDAQQSPQWIKSETGTYECRVCLVPEEDGGYSAFIPPLPGVASQGETEEEAIENIAEAFRGVVEVYMESGQSIPWVREAIPKPNNAKERWIVVNV